MNISKILAKRMPGIDSKLKQAAIFEQPEYYIKKTLFTATTLSVAIAFVIFIFYPNILVFLSVILLIPLLFSYFVRYVDVKIIQIERKIDEEIVFAGRFLIIELESGVPIYTAFENIQTNYKFIGAYFGDIINKVYLGTNMEEAINETLINTPSANLRRVLWQVLNSLKTGSDIAPSLNTVIDQIVREQQIAVKEYGKKLNPMAMFYMMISVIMPSLGTVMIVVLATFLSLNIGLVFLLAIAAFVGLIQFMFMTMIKGSRPPISM